MKPRAEALRARHPTGNDVVHVGVGYFDHNELAGVRKLSGEVWDSGFSGP